LFQEAPGGLYAFKRAIARVLDDLRVQIQEVSLFGVVRGDFA
jgi:hypothetical protein